jgi:hypothetical protein
MVKLKQLELPLAQVLAVAILQKVFLKLAS